MPDDRKDLFFAFVLHVAAFSGTLQVFTVGWWMNNILVTFKQRRLNERLENVRLLSKHQVVNCTHKTCLQNQTPVKTYVNSVLNKRPASF